MAKYVLTIKEDVCKANGKDINAVELLKVMAHYGEVQTFEKLVANEVAPLQETIDNLVKQIDAIQDQNLTDDDRYEQQAPVLNPEDYAVCRAKDALVDNLWY